MTQLQRGRDIGLAYGYRDAADAARDALHRICGTLIRGHLLKSMKSFSISKKKML